MSFLPSDPFDGQIVTHSQPDGSVLVATYSRQMNEWTMVRQHRGATPVGGSPAIVVTPTADRQVPLWDATANTWIAGTTPPPRLQDLADVVQSDTPHLGTMPIWQYAAGQDQKSGRFNYATPPAHVKNWEAVVHWESGAAVYHKGLIWRATKENSNIEPAAEEGRCQLYVHVPGEPTFGIVPTGVDANPPPAGEQPMGFKLGYWLQYTDDHHMTVWKWVMKGLDPATRHPYGVWEARPWTCMAWRSPNPPSAVVPPGTVAVWIRGEPTSTAHPITGQQAWATLELRTYLSQCSDVDAATPANDDLLIYSVAKHKWAHITLADLAAKLGPLLAPHTHP